MLLHQRRSTRAPRNSQEVDMTRNQKNEKRQEEVYSDNMITEPITVQAQQQTCMLALKPWNTGVIIAKSRDITPKPVSVYRNVSLRR